MPGDSHKDSQQEAQAETFDLSESEQWEIAKRSNPKAAVLHEAIRLEGEDELKRRNFALAWSSLAAGLSMGFSLMAEGLIHAHLPDTPWRPLIASLGYPVGFIIVILGRQQLYTETTLTVVLPLLNHFRMRRLLRVMKYWLIVLSSNLVGTLLFAWVMAKTKLFSPEVREALITIGLSAAEGDFWSIFLRAFFAGWLIALMTWLLPGAGASKLSVIIILTYLVALGKLAHVIAGSTEVLYAVIDGSLSWGDYGYYMLPTLLGNSIGGVTLVAFLNFAQVAPEKD
jgi:formate/nitrite transporter FocA (FNT family)